MGELSVLIGRLKAIITEIESIVSKQPMKKKTKDEYLAMNEKDREEYDKKQVDGEVEEEKEEKEDEE